MATSELAPAPGGVPGPNAAGTWAGSRTWTGLPVLIGGALLAAILYSAFAHGAVARSVDTRIELIVAGLSALAALGWIWLGTLRFRAPRVTFFGAGLLVAYAGWSALSVLWSVNPDQSWIEVNRIVTYALVLGLGIAVGSSYSRSADLVAQGFLVSALAVAVYALGQKLLPGLHVSGVFNLNQTSSLARLQEPLGYWNALALFLVMAAPAALALAADRRRSPSMRLSAAWALTLILTTVPLTYSRGGLIALVVALGVSVGAGRERLRSLVWLGAAVIAALPAILVGLLLHELSSANVSLGSREWAGGILAAAVVGGAAALVVAGQRLLAIDPGLRLSERRAAGLRRRAWVIPAALVVACLLALSLSHRGLTGEASHLWHGFTNPQGATNNNPQRLLSADSYRWLWWKEAADAFRARPWRGWGAGSFPVLHLLYRRNTLPVQQPHDVPLQFLAETGVIGALLGIGAFLLLAAGALRAVRSHLPGRERLLGAALLGAVVAYGVHCLYDWDWNIPALSLPAFLFMGVLAGRRRGQRAGTESRPAPPRPGSMLRALALAGVSAWLCIFALSVELPQLAAERASAALISASSPSRAIVRSAQNEASLAARLDPLSDSGLVAQATVALHEARPRSAQILLQQAVGRNPSDSEAWQLLAQVDYALGDKTASLAAVQRAVDLDPMGSYGRSVVRGELHTSPPGLSATRIAARR